MSSSHNQDLSLKLRFRRILFVQGYYTPLEIELSHYEYSTLSAKRSSFTDLDVLGIKYDTMFTAHRVIGDCKSGNISDVNRLFWLRGVADYFSADDGYLLLAHTDDRARTLAGKMKLRVFDEVDLDFIEKSLRVDHQPIPLADIPFYNQRASLWGINVPKGSKPTQEQLLFKKVYSYIDYLFWYIEPHRNLANLVERFQSIAHLLDSTNPKHVLLAYEGLVHFALALMDMASFIYTQGVLNVPRNAAVYLYGGHDQAREKERMFSILQQATGTKEQLAPPYLPEVVEYVHRLLKNPEAASNVLIYIDATYSWCVQLNNVEIETVFQDKFRTSSLVLAREACYVFCRSAGLSPDLFKALMSL